MTINGSTSMLLPKFISMIWATIRGEKRVCRFWGIPFLIENRCVIDFEKMVLKIAPNER